MSSRKDGTIEMVVREDEDESRSSRVELVNKAVDVGVLREKFKSFMSGLQSIIELEPDDEDPFHLKQIQFSAEISAQGDFKLLGTGAGIASKSAVTFVLERKQDAK
jgi:hypothetical protein